MRQMAMCTLWICYSSLTNCMFISYKKWVREKSIQITHIYLIWSWWMGQLIWISLNSESLAWYRSPGGNNWLETWALHRGREVHPNVPWWATIGETELKLIPLSHSIGLKHHQLTFKRRVNQNCINSHGNKERSHSEKPIQDSSDIGSQNEKSIQSHMSWLSFRDKLDLLKIYPMSQQILSSPLDVVNFPKIGFLYCSIHACF